MKRTLGVLYGTVTWGEVQWDLMGTGHLNVKLLISGGTQALDGITSDGEFAATVRVMGFPKFR